MPRVSHVTSSGFAFDRQESTVVVRCPRPLVPLAELEYLRELGPRGGRIAAVERTSGGGRELHRVTVEVPGPGGRATFVFVFDAGPALLGRLHEVTDGLMLAVYGLAGAVAVGTLGYLIVRLATH